MILLWSMEVVDRKSEILPLRRTFDHRADQLGEQTWRRYWRKSFTKVKILLLFCFFLNDVVSLKWIYPLFFTLEDPSLFRGALNKVGTRRMKLRFYQTSNAGLVTRLIVTNVFKMFFAGMKEFSLYWLQTEMEFHSWKVNQLKVKAQWIFITTV